MISQIFVNRPKVSCALFRETKTGRTGHRMPTSHQSPICGLFEFPGVLRLCGSSLCSQKKLIILRCIHHAQTYPIGDLYSRISICHSTFRCSVQVANHGKQHSSTFSIHMHPPKPSKNHPKTIPKHPKTIQNHPKMKIGQLKPQGSSCLPRDPIKVAKLWALDAELLGRGRVA